MKRKEWDLKCVGFKLWTPLAYSVFNSYSASHCALKDSTNSQCSWFTFSEASSASVSLE